MRKTHRVRVTSGLYQLRVAPGGLGMRPRGDAAEQRRERDAQQPGHRRQLGLALGHHLAGPVVHEIDVAQKQHRGEDPHHVHERDAQKTCNGKHDDYYTFAVRYDFRSLIGTVIEKRSPICERAPCEI